MSAPLNPYFAAVSFINRFSHNINTLVNWEPNVPSAEKRVFWYVSFSLLWSLFIDVGVNQAQRLMYGGQKCEKGTAY